MKFEDDRELIFLDMDGVLVDFEGEILRLSLQNLKKPDTGKLCHTPGFYGGLKPIPGAIDAYHQLKEKYNVYILSTPSWTNLSSWSDKRKWVGDNLGGSITKKVILSHNKGLFSGRALIDDNIKNNQEAFGGELIRFGKDPFLTWDKVLEYLL